MILKQAQAKAFYDAQCAANNVGGVVTFDAPIGGSMYVRVFPYENVIRVALIHSFELIQHEDYPTQNAFAEAYGVAI